MSPRPPLDPDRLGPRGPWRFEVLPTSPSTNAELVSRFREGDGAGLVVAAEHQTAGRGRLDRSWEVPERAGLTVSFLLSPQAPVERWPWLPLVAGIAVASAVRRCTGIAAGLKWPNDVLVEDRKLAGILVERVEGSAGAAAVVGIGLNVDQTRAELPIELATSLSLEGVAVDRTTLLLAVADELADAVTGWEVASVRDTYLALCGTVGRRVRVEQPGGVVTEGDAVDVADDGRLVVRSDDGVHRLGAGDVVHVRSA